MPAFTGTSGDDTFTGGVGNDTAAGAAGADKLTGADGQDLLSGGAGADTLDGGAGDDVLYSGEVSPDYRLPYYNNPYVLPRLDTGSERDNLIGGDGSDRLFAGYGDNVDGGPDGTWGDYLYISFQGAPSGVTADFSLTTQTIGGGVITGVEYISYVQGSQFGDNLKIGSSFTGLDGTTAVSGMGGNDTLTAGYYTGSMFGDDGDDVIDGRGSQYLSTIEGGAGDDILYTPTNSLASVDGGAGDDTIYGHRMIHGGTGNDIIVVQVSYYPGPVYGDEGDDRITASGSGNPIAGGSGADTLNGSSVDDMLFSADFFGSTSTAADDFGLERDRLSGGGGDDTLAAGYGDDVDGGSGNDVLQLSFAGATSGVSANLSALGTGSSASVGGALIQNVESLRYLRGSDLADQLTLPTQGVMITVNAGGGNDVVTSQGSSASVLGGTGDDRLLSGPAADTFDGGSGADTIDYSGATGGVSVNLRTGAGAGGDVLFGVEGAIGSAFNDTLSGTGSGSTLTGGSGDDRIEAASRDIATLGAGSDLVSIAAGSHSASAQSAVVTINDWTAADRLQFAGTSGSYLEATAVSYDAALRLAEAQVGGGYNFVSVQVGSDVYVFGQPTAGRLHFDDAVRLVGVGLDAVSAANVGGAAETGPTPSPPTPSPPAPSPPTPSPPSPGVSLTGSSGTEELQGGSGNDTLSGAGGDDSLQGKGGDDRLDGGAGNDFAVYLNAPGGVTVNLGVSGPQNTGDGIDTLISIENLSGSLFNDSLTGDANANLLYGWTGDDTLVGLAGDDTLDGREGADVQSGGDGNDHLMGSIGADTLSGGAGADVFEFVLTGDAVASSAVGGNAAVLDRILDWSSEDFLQFWGAARSSAGNYVETTAAGYDSAYSQAQAAMGGGAEYVAAQVGGDVIVFAPRYNEAVVLVGRSLNDISASNVGPTPGAPAPPPTGLTLTGTAGNDELQGASLADTLSGLGGDDMLQGKGGDDRLDGGAGTDTAVYLNAPGGVNVNLSLSGAQNTGDGTDTLISIENISGSLFNDSLTGDANGNLLQGWTGADTLVGLSGDDTLDGREGADVQSGGDGNDHLMGSIGADTLSGGAGADVFEFNLTGDAAASSAVGGHTELLDRITDWSTSDFLQFWGAPTGVANNYMEIVASSYDSAFSQAQTVLSGGVEYFAAQVGGDVFVFAKRYDQAVILAGRTLDDVSYLNMGPTAGAPPPLPAGVNLIGTAGNDDLQGAGLADTLSGAAGDDVLQGKGGDDRLDGGAGTDEASYLNAPAGVSVNLAFLGVTQNTGGDGIDVLISIENLSGSLFNDTLAGDGNANLLRGWSGRDVLYGFGGDDTVDGRDGADFLQGGDGNDHLQGGSGADVLAGGAGADVFEFNLTGDAAASSALGGNTAVLDQILDWSSADFLQVWGAPTADAGNYREITTNGGYDAAYSQALGGFTDFGIEYTVAQVGADVIVFAPRFNQAVVLTGRSLSDISLGNVGPTPGLPAPPTTSPPPSSGPTPTAGDDSLTATASAPEIHAGAGNDTIKGGAFDSYLRGDDGADSIVGGNQFDDINGNVGDDTAMGGLGDDWVVGGKDNDMLMGEAGSDLVYGNLGNDTCDGGDGADIVRGGQGDDVVRGGSGDDFVSGDRGDDTMTGGAGADSFHTFSDAGIDRVLDFSVAQGDRVQLDPGTTYTVAQVGADTVITMSAGQMTLVGVQFSSLPVGWIFGS